MQIQERYLLLVLQSFDFFNIFNDRNLQFFGSHLIFLKSPQVGKRHRHFTEEKNKYSLDYEMILLSPIVKEMQVKMAVCMCVLSPVWFFATPWTEAHQAPLSMGFSRQEYWSKVAISHTRESSQPRDQTWNSWVSCIVKQIFFYHCSIWEVPPFYTWS